MSGITFAITRLKLLSTQSPQIFAQCLPNKRGTVDARAFGRQIRRPKQLRIQHNSDRLHIVEHTPRIILPSQFSCICLDTYMHCAVYTKDGIRVRDHCRAEPSRDTEPTGLVTTVGGRDRASASYAAANRIQAPARAARSRLCGSNGGRTAPSLSVEAGTISAGRCLAGSVPPVLVRPHRCSGTPSRSHGSIINTNDKKEDWKKAEAAQTADVTMEKQNENQADKRVRG